MIKTFAVAAAALLLAVPAVAQAQTKPATTRPKVRRGAMNLPANNAYAEYADARTKQ